MYIEVFMSKETKCGSWSVIFHVLFRLVQKYKMAAIDFLIFLKSGSVIPNTFHIYARWNEYGSGKSSRMFLNRFLPDEV